MCVRRLLLSGCGVQKKCDEKFYKQYNLDHRNAYICVNKILLKLDKEITQEDFEKEFANLDFDGDEDIS